jgi:glycine/D-amino acid oxidase-like deaminating enzyme
VVIGAGFTGLAVARQLAHHQPAWRIVVLDAQRVGEGASGRNSGFVVDVGHHHPGWSLEVHRAIADLGRAGVAHLRRQVDAHAIDCDWSERGRLHGGASDDGVRALEKLARGLDALHEPYERLDAAAMAARTGTSFYRAGLHTPGGAIVQPAALVRGLASALPANVDLFEDSPVRAIEARQPLRIDAGQGTVTTDRVVLATNGYTPGLGFLRRQIFPLWTFGSLTRVLTPADQAALGGETEWGAVCEIQMGGTVRRTRDQRILIRNTVHYGARISRALKQQVSDNHRRALCARFPQLAHVDFAHTWSGLMGVSLNGAHFFGAVADGVFAAGGYNGVGVAMGSIAGTLLADFIVGADSALLSAMRSLPAPSWIPPEPLLGVGVRTTLARLRAKARPEQ